MCQNIHQKIRQKIHHEIRHKIRQKNSKKKSSKTLGTKVTQFPHEEKGPHLRQAN